MKRPAVPMKQIAAAFGSRGQTDLYAWFRDNFEALPEYRRYRVNWVALTDQLNRLGIRGRDKDKSLNEGIVRKTYERVRRDKDATAALAAPGPPRPVVRSTTGAQPDPLPLSPSTTPPTPVWPGTDRKPRYTFKTASFKKSPEDD